MYAAAPKITRHARERRLSMRDLPRRSSIFHGGYASFCRHGWRPVASRPSGALLDFAETKWVIDVQALSFGSAEVETERDNKFWDLFSEEWPMLFAPIEI